MCSKVDHGVVAGHGATYGVNIEQIERKCRCAEAFKCLEALERPAESSDLMARTEQEWHGMPPNHASCTSHDNAHAVLSRLKLHVSLTTAQVLVKCSSTHGEFVY